MQTIIADVWDENCSVREGWGEMKCFFVTIRCPHRAREIPPWPVDRPKLFTCLLEWSSTDWHIIWPDCRKAESLANLIKLGYSLWGPPQHPFLWSESFLKIDKWFSREIIHNAHMQGHPNTNHERKCGKWGTDGGNWWWLSKVNGNHDFVLIKSSHHDRQLLRHVFCV